MNFAIITAAGKGTRANLNVPKQFFLVNDKPLICYTLDVFEKCSSIDKIVLVLDKEHLNNAPALFDEYCYKKLCYFCEGGETNELSIFNGVKLIKSIAKPDDIIIVHDGVRCLVTDEIIQNNIDVCIKYGNAITATPVNEAILQSDDLITSNSFIDRTRIVRTQTPHSMRFKDLFELMDSNIRRGNISSVALCTLLIESNQTVYFSKGSNSNFKITNHEDIELFRSYLMCREE